MNWVVKFADPDLSELRQTLLSAAPLEAGAVLLCNHAPNTLIVDSVLVPTRADLDAQTSTRLQISTDFLAKAVKRARKASQSIVLVHTHPTSTWPRFSFVDNAGENDLVPVLQARVPGRSHGAIVFGKTGFAGRIYRDETRLPEDISELRQIGRTINREVATESGRLSLSEFATFDRNVRAFGRQGQRQLSALRVGIVGLGGTGSIVAEQLAHLGVGEFVLIDPDEVEATNLNRLVGATFQDVGAAKVHVLARYMKSLRSTELEVDAVQADVLREHAQTKLLSCDFVFCCTDTHGSRAALVQLAYQYLIPMIDMGVRIDAEDGVITAMAGRTQMLAPGLPCLQCQHLLDPEAVRRDFMTEEARRADPYITSGNEAQPSVISLNGTVASLSITMFLAAMVGVPSRARDLVYRIMEGIVKPATSSASPHCVVCSRSGALAKGDSWPLLTK